MHLLFTDETNRTAKESKGVEFFIYGGLAIPGSSAQQLHQEIERIRNTHGFRSTDPLKFSRAEIPKRISKDTHTAAKKAVIRACEQAEATFFVSVCHHKIARSQGFAKTLEMNANTVIGTFNSFIRIAGDCGVVLADRTDEGKPFDYLRERFQIGLKMQDGRSHRLDKVVALGQTCDGASHFSSATDVVLGSFRYHREHDRAANALLPGVVRLLWKSSDGTATGYGLNYRPVNIRVRAYQDAYAELKEYLAKAKTSAMVASRRRALGWTQEELAIAAEVSRSTISHIETRRNYDSLDVVHAALAEAEAAFGSD